MEGYEAFSDEELIEKMHRGESGISDYLLNKYKDQVRLKARAMYLIGGETDDLIQEGMLGLFKAVRDYRPDKNTSFQTFASLCIERQLYSTIQKYNRQKHMPLNSYVSLSQEEEVKLHEPSGQNPETLMIDREDQEQLYGEIQKALSKLENKVLSLYLKGYSYEHIAQILGKSSKSIDNALQRVRGKVRICIEKQDYTEKQDLVLTRKL